MTTNEMFKLIKKFLNLETTNVKKLLKSELTDLDILETLGYKTYIRNGVGYGFISEEDLYDNCQIEIGFGRVRSGYGDWGGGFSHTTDSPLKLIIDSEMNIIKSSTHSFYNSDDSKKVEKKAIKLMEKLGKKLIVKNDLLKECLETLFKELPVKNHIGLEIEYTSPKYTLEKTVDYVITDKDYYKDKIRNSKSLETKI